MLYTNADSLPNKLDELKARIQYCEGSMDIIEMNPTKCRYYPGKAELQIDGYDLFLDENNEVKKEVLDCILEGNLKLKR